MTILCSPKVTQHHGQVNTPLPPGWTFLPTGKIRARPRLATLPVVAVFTRAQMSSRKLSTLRACGADDETAPRTPSAWMLLLAPSLACGQIVFFGWVSLSEQKWVILAERRGSGDADQLIAPAALMMSSYFGRSAKKDDFR